MIPAPVSVSFSAGIGFAVPLLTDPGYMVKRVPGGSQR